MGLKTNCKNNFDVSIYKHKGAHVLHEDYVRETDREKC